MCPSCVPGSGQLASWLLHDLDLSNLPQTPAVSTRNAADEDFCNGVILTMAGGTLSPVDGLVVRDDTINYSRTIESAKEAAGSDAETTNLDATLCQGSSSPISNLS